MATQPEYSAVANALLHLLDDYVTQNVPDVGPPFSESYQKRALRAMPGVAGSLAKMAVDTVDAYRKAHAPSSAPPAQGNPQ